MKKIILISALCIFCLGVASAEVEFPSPKGFVNDYAGILSDANKQQLESITRELKQNTGAELAIAIVKSVAPLDSKLYAVKLFEKWGIGEKGKDNGVLLLVALDERRVEIEVGYGLEGILTDAMCGRILDSFAVPNFRKGEMGEGILQTAQALAKVISGEEVQTAAPSAEEVELPEIPGALVFWSLVVLAGLAIFGFIKKQILLPTLSFGLGGALLGYLTDEIIVIFLFFVFWAFWGFFLAHVFKHGLKGGKGPGGWRSGGWSSGGGGFGGGGGGFGGGGSGGGGAGRGW